MLSTEEGDDSSKQSLLAKEEGDLSYNSQKSTLLTVTPFILVTEFCERLAFYGFSGSLVLFLQKNLDYSNATADIQFALWAGACYLTPLLGGWLADRYWGRFKTILVFCVIYVMGLALIVSGSSPDTISPGLIFPAMYVIALGTGGIKPNVSTFGADQFDPHNPRDQREKESFFNYFYWSVNLGSFISYAVVTYVCQYGIQGLGGKDWGFFVGYSIPLISMTLGVFVFISGKNKYNMLPPGGSVVEETIAIVKEAIVRRKEAPDAPHWLDRASVAFGGSFAAKQVKDVKILMELTPFLLSFVAFWGINRQMSTTFQNQGCQMDLSMGSIEISVSAINMFNTLSILLLIPVFDKIIFPYFKRRGRPLTMLQKIGLGYLFAALSMVCAAIVEINRKDMVTGEDGPYPMGKDEISACKDVYDYNPYKYQAWYSDHSKDEPLYCHKVSGCDTFDANGKLDLSCIKCDDIPRSSKMSVFYQIPQFVLVGTSEILAAITGLEFFYSQSPSTMRSVAQALNLLTTALGSFVMIPLIYLVNVDKHHEWISEDLNNGYLENYFFLLAALMVLCTLIFAKQAKDYVYKNIGSEEEEAEEKDEEDDTKQLLPAAFSEEDDF